MESKELATKVMDTICSLAFSEGGGAQQVRCLELLRKHQVAFRKVYLMLDDGSVEELVL